MLLSRRGIGYLLVAMGALLVILAWAKSYPLSMAPAGHLYDSIYPSYWIGLAVANAGLFLVASGSKYKFERIFCAVLFFLFAFSLRFFFTYISGPDSDYFRGLTENLIATGSLQPQLQPYYQWPIFFLLNAMSSEILGLDVRTISFILFLVWTITFASLLFFYKKPTNDVMDFLSVATYVIVPFPFLNWQFAAQSLALVLFLACINLLTRKGRGSLILTIVIYTALVLDHAFFALLLILVIIALALRDRRQALLVLPLGLVFTFYFVFQASILAVHLAHSLLLLALFREYISTASYTLAPAVPGIDEVAQIMSRSLSISLAAVLGILTLRSILSRKIRSIDIALIFCGAAEFAAGTVIPYIGSRALQIIMVPISNSLRGFSSKILRRTILVYLLLVLTLFPLSLVHLHYQEIQYMTSREQHAADAILIPLYNASNGMNSTTDVRYLVGQYLSAKTATSPDFVTEDDGIRALTNSSVIKYLLASPELTTTLSKHGYSASALAELASMEFSLSRVYSDGRVTIYLNQNAAPTKHQ